MFSLFAKYKTAFYLGGIVLIVGSAFVAGAYVNGSRWEAKLLTCEANHEKAVAKSIKEALEQAEAFRLQEGVWRKQIEEVQNVLVAETAKNTRTIVALAADRDILRRSITNFATNSKSATDSIAACRGDAATLGALLGDTLQREEGFAAAAETHGASTRSLLAAWPK